MMKLNFVKSLGVIALASVVLAGCGSSGTTGSADVPTSGRNPQKGEPVTDTPVDQGNTQIPGTTAGASGTGTTSGP